MSTQKVNRRGFVEVRTNDPEAQLKRRRPDERPLLHGFPQGATPASGSIGLAHEDRRHTDMKFADTIGSRKDFLAGLILMLSSTEYCSTGSKGPGGKSQASCVGNAQLIAKAGTKSVSK